MRRQSTHNRRPEWTLKLQGGCLHFSLLSNLVPEKTQSGSCQSKKLALEEPKVSQSTNFCLRPSAKDQGITLFS